MRSSTKNILYGPWWWSSGQHALLLLQQSEFESRWGLQFFCIIVVEKNENKQKEAGVGPFLKKTFSVERISRYTTQVIQKM